MLEHLWCCTDWITPDNTDWTNTTVWRYLNLHQWYISKRYSSAISHGVFIKCKHFRSMLHYLQVTHPTVLCCVTGLATFTFITMAFFLSLSLWMNEGLSDLSMPAVYTNSYLTLKCNLFLDGTTVQCAPSPP